MSAVTEKKAAQMSTDLLNHARDLLNLFKEQAVTVEPGSKFMALIDKLSDYMEVASNLDANKEVQGAMHALSEEVQEECNDKFGRAVLHDLTEFLDKQWQAMDSSDSLDLTFDNTDAATTVLHNVKIQGHSEAIRVFAPNHALDIFNGLIRSSDYKRYLDYRLESKDDKDRLD